MKIKKTTHNQSFLDSPRFQQRLKTNLSLKQKQQQRFDKQIQQLDKIVNRDHKSVQTLKINNNLRFQASNYLNRLLKRSLTQSPNQNKPDRSQQFYNSKILSPQEVVVRQRYKRLNQNNSQISASKRQNKKVIVQKYRTTQNSISKIHFNQRNKIKQNSFQNQNDMNKITNKQILPEDIKIFKSYNNVDRRNQRKKQKSLVTLTTIKQKIEKYLAEEQSKMNQLRKNSPLFANNPKLKLYNKNNNQNFNPVLSTINRNLDLSAAKSQNQIHYSIYPNFGQQSSLIKKKQSKHLNQMLKRRLNFSMMNKSIKVKQEINKINKNDQFYQINKNNEILKRGLNQINKSRSLNVRDEVKKSNDFINPQSPNQNQNALDPYQKIRLISQLLNSSNSQQLENQTLKQKPQYNFNLYYYPPSSIQKGNFNQQKSLQQTFYPNNCERYQEWKKQNKTEEKLKQLLKYQSSDPIDPLEYYQNVFNVNLESKKNKDHKNYYLHSINSLISQKNTNKKQPALIINSSNLHEQKTKFRFFHQNQTPSPSKQKSPTNILSKSSFIQQKIIFVNKKQKQNLKQKKLSNLLYKIEKRNNQIQKKMDETFMGETFNFQNYSKKKHINNNQQDQTEDNMKSKQFLNIQKDGKKNAKNIRENYDNMALSAPLEESQREDNTHTWRKKEKQPKQKQKQDWSTFEPWKIAGTQNHNYIELEEYHNKP